MKRYYSLPVIAILCLFLSACDKDDDKVYGAGPPPNTSSTSIYPLVVGHEWIYYRELGFVDSSDFTDTVLYQGYCIKRIDRMQTLPDSSVTFAMEFIDSTSSGTGLSGTQFYNNTSTGLYHYGYVYGSTGGVYLMQEPQHYYRVGDMYFNSWPQLLSTLKYGGSIRADSVIVNSPPKLAIKNPLVVNDEWIYTTEVFLIKKKYVGDELVQTVFGDFLCKKLEWFYDTNNDGNWEDIHIMEYISPAKGLLKEVFTANVILMDNTGAPVDTGYATDVSIAVSINF